MKRFMSLRGSLITIVSFVIGVFVGLFSSDRVEEKVEYETKVFSYIRPSITSLTDIEPIKVSIPKIAFAEADTVKTIEFVNIREDSVDVTLNYERRVYEDSTYRAVVSGVAVNDIHPTLEHIDIYSTTTTKVELPKRPLFAPYATTAIGSGFVSVGAGVVIKDRYGLGVDYAVTKDGGNTLFRYTHFF